METVLPEYLYNQVKEHVTVLDEIIDVFLDKNMPSCKTFDNDFLIDDKYNCDRKQRNIFNSASDNEVSIEISSMIKQGHDKFMFLKNLTTVPTNKYDLQYGWVRDKYYLRVVLEINISEDYIKQKKELEKTENSILKGRGLW